MQIENVLDSKEEALKFINKYGYVTLFPIKGKSFPSLYRATKGTREEKFDRAWRWADELSLDKKQIHYGKLIQGQVTLISMAMLPCFYRLYSKSKFAGTPEKILSFIRQNGATSTTELRKNLGLSGANKKQEFTKAMNLLQTSFAIAIVSKGKPPRHTHTWNLTENWIPEELLNETESISKQDARARIVAKLLENHVASSPEEAETILRLKP